METASRPLDLLVVGGGINGAGIARDAAGRGLSVLLCEQHDLAAHTSSASTKLIHGGLRYLEFYQFGLVRKALREREVLLSSAPHIMWPMGFVLPHDSQLRPAWVIRAGLFLYDHLARRRRLAGSRSIDLRRHEAGEPIDPRFRRAFLYTDVWVDDARLVVLNAMDAAERGAEVRTRTRCERLEALDGQWLATLQGADGRSERRLCRIVVNATGPWAASFRAAATPAASRHGLRLVKGSHIVVPRLFGHDNAYILQAPDRRIVFAIPYEQDFTLIGTTDVDYDGPPERARIDVDETRYLCAVANRYFRRRIGPSEVVWAYSGVRPLLEDESTDARSATRDYALELVMAPAPLLSVFGGKITTYRTLAEEALARLAPLHPRAAGPWTGNARLPGGDLPDGDFEAFGRAVAARYPAIDPALRRRLARSYGTRIDRLLEGVRTSADLGPELAPGLHARELEYLWHAEWARSAEDVLWRRSKLGLRCDAAATERVARWFASRDHE